MALECFPDLDPSIRARLEQHLIGRADERDARRAAAGEDGDDVHNDDDDGGYDDGVVLPHQDRIGHDITAVNKATVQFYERIVQEMEEQGENDASVRPAYAEWKNMMVVPDDPMISVPFDPSAWDVEPIFFFDPTVYFRRIGMADERPCARGGWAHSRYVKTTLGGKFRNPRLVKGRGSDFGACAVSMACSCCRRERLGLARQLAAARTQLGPTSGAVVQLEKRVDECKYGFNALHPQYIAHLAERYPFLHAAIKFYTSHKAAITHEVKLDAFRAMRVMKSSHDLEAEYDELRGLEATLKQVAFASAQRCVLKHEERKLRLTNPNELQNRPPINELWVEFQGDGNVSRISDNFLTDIQLSESDKNEIYFNQWHEQHVERGPLVHFDHCGKRDNAIQLCGTLFNVTHKGNCERNNHDECCGQVRKT